MTIPSRRSGGNGWWLNDDDARLPHRSLKCAQNAVELRYRESGIFSWHIFVPESGASWRRERPSKQPNPSADTAGGGRTAAEAEGFGKDD
jgi:hypothetical protein